MKLTRVQRRRRKKKKKKKKEQKEGAACDNCLLIAYIMARG
jgi:hypothetical protein